MSPDRFPGIKRAALAIAYNNGFINRRCTQREYLNKLGRWLEQQPYEQLPDINAWLASLSDDNVEVICAEDVTTAEPIMRTAPPFTDDFLDRCFDEVG